MNRTLEQNNDAATARPSSFEGRRFFGLVVARARGRAVQELLSEDTPIWPLAAEVECVLGSYVVAVCQDDAGEPHASIQEILAAPGTPLSGLYALAADSRLNPLFPDSVLSAAERCQQAPGLDDEELTDLTDLPLVTIDGAHSRDLDQAVFVRSQGGGHTAYYALADASHYVVPGSELWEEAQRRGASYYLPGLMVPMLPRSLSEGLISLNPGVLRRSMVFEMQIDSSGACTRTRVIRATIRSRGKLSFGQVQTFLDGGRLESAADAEVAGTGLWAEEERDAVEDNLRNLRAVGNARLQRAEEQGVIRFRRQEMNAGLTSEGQKFVATVEVRRPVESYNEQLSLLCNSEGARLLSESSEKPFVEPIYRVHPAPQPARLNEFRQLIRHLARAHDLPPDSWEWQPGESLAEHLARLPESGPHARIAKVVHRQAVMVNVRSTYQEAPAPHFGVGASEYARFSAPMREMVGIFLHRELCEALAHSGNRDDEMVQALMHTANRAKQTQKRLTNAANLMVLDQLFGDEMQRDVAQRGLPATILGLTASRAYVQLDSPPIDARVSVRDLCRQLSVRSLQLTEGDTTLRDEAGAVRFRLGDAVSVVVLGPRGARKRWPLGLRRRTSPA